MKLFYKYNDFLINKFKAWFNYIKSLKVWQRVIYFILLSLFVALPFISSIIFLLLLLLIFSIKLIFYVSNTRYNKSVQCNGIIVGNRGSGKGMLLQIHAKYVKTYYSNVDNGYNYMPLDIHEYINSLAPNTIINAINNDIIKINKLTKYEGVPILLDDTTLYFPNFEEKFLKVKYNTMPLTLAVSRHLYNNYMIITSQNFERPYKILRELQTDFFIKALKTIGFNKFFESIPILRKYAFIKYRYYDEYNSALNGVLPFKAVGLINETTKHAYLSTGQSLKEIFKAENGNIYHSWVAIKKDNIKYNTRHFHQVFYAEKI